MSDNTFSSHTPGAVLAASAAGGAARVLPSSATDPNAIRPFRFASQRHALRGLGTACALRVRCARNLQIASQTELKISARAPGARRLPYWRENIDENLYRDSSMKTKLLVASYILNEAMSPIGPLRHFAAKQQSVAFGR